jgi:hypothetical protein
VSGNAANDWGRAVGVLALVADPIEERRKRVLPMVEPKPALISPPPSNTPLSGDIDMLDR